MSKKEPLRWLELTQTIGWAGKATPTKKIAESKMCKCSKCSNCTNVNLSAPEIKKRENNLQFPELWGHCLVLFEVILAAVNKQFLCTLYELYNEAQ